MGNLLRNQKGEFNYLFNWMDNDGIPNGFNDVWAPNMKEARRRAKKMESPAREFVHVDYPSWGEYKGMYINPTSFRKATVESSAEMDRVAWMLIN